jgi:creatinine amidohydrolase/Fe(II)-dependent formamide hydrolase-like protein
MTTTQISALDRTRTVVVIPNGILEQHGPYLPSFSDGFQNQWLAERLSEAITSRPGWSVVVFPTIPLGVGGANEIGGKYVFPGTYAVRSTTLRAVFMDHATTLGEQGFQWIFVVDDDGAPNNRRALNQAGDYFHDTYGGQMVDLDDLKLPPAENPLTSQDRARDGEQTDANALEVSLLLFLRPDLVGEGYKTARTYAPTQTIDQSAGVAAKADWEGYFGDPTLATSDYGRRYMEAVSRRMNEAAIRILDGEDPRRIGRMNEPSGRSVDPVSAGALRAEDIISRRQQEWLRRSGLE